MKPELKAPLKELLDDPSDEMTIERVRRRVSATRRVPGRRLGPALAAAAAVALIGVALYATYGRGDGALERVGGAPLARLSGEAVVDLSDRSQLALGPGAVVEVLENTGERVVLVQGDGVVEYEVEPGGPRRWTIDAGALSVDVVGTRFTVARDGGRVSVAVARGRVRIRGAGVPGGLRSLGRGEEAIVGEPLARGAAEVVGTRGPETEPATDEAGPEIARPGTSGDDSLPAEGSGTEASGAEPAERPADPTASPEGPIETASTGERRSPAPRWRALAARGQYDEAFAALGEDGHREATARARTVDELWALSDTARLSGHAALAVAPLSRIVEEHAQSPRAATAALSLGRVQLDALDRPAEAIRWLERASELGLPAHLRETALARQVEAHRRAGHIAQARTLAAAYLAEYPEGRYRDAVRRGL